MLTQTTVAQGVVMMSVLLALLAIFTLAPGVSATLNQLQVISGGPYSPAFGAASWMTPDGSIAVVGARGNSTVLVLVRQPDGSYSTEQVIVGPSGSSFGYSAAITVTVWRSSKQVHQSAPRASIAADRRQ